MKRIVNHPPRPQRPKMWRSLDELENAPGFEEWLHREFPRGADVYEDGGLSRRDFMKLMGASMALAGVGLTACRRPEKYLVPFTDAVEWTIPGKPLYYATSMPTRNGAMPLIATTVDGRPTKMEGNPLHPASLGATDAFAQASVLDLYDPHRAKDILRDGKKALREELDDFLRTVRERFAGNGAGFAVLAEPSESPTRRRLRAELEAAFPGMVWAEYDPLQGFARQAVETAYGAGAVLAPDFEQADVILALDSDFLNAAETGPAYARGFYSRRSPDQTNRPMNRLYVAENHYSLTGGMADHRLPLKASLIGAFAKAIGAEIATRTGSATLRQAVEAFPASEAEFDADWVRECAADLAASGGASVVLCGPMQPVEVQLLVLAINDALGAYGRTLRVLDRGADEPAADISTLAEKLREGEVRTLFILGANPVYNAPADLDFAGLLARAHDSLQLSLFENETSRKAHWHVPAAHYLESWSDGRSLEGVYSAAQPMILPLWDGIPELELLAALLGRDEIEGPELVRETFSGIVTTSGDAMEQAWNEFLRKGFLDNSAWPEKRSAFDAAAAAAVIAEATPVEPRAKEIVFLQSSSLDDGRYANNSWLQETPDFVTKLTWDNALLVSPHDAEKMKLSEGSLVEVAVNGSTLQAAVHIAPGHADNSYSIALGYGHDDVSPLMDNVGFDAYPLRVTGAMRFRTGVEVKPTGGSYKLAQTQLHHNMEGRDLAREGTLATYRDDPAFPTNTMGEESFLTSPVVDNISLYHNPPLTAKEQWAMSIDLNTCTGCNACLVACRAENNVPVVGKDQVLRGRDMAWIRLDRWFAGEPDNPEMVAMGILCQQCENAPCETVCPVNATVHSEDGLNLMAYNRCIGTRYCANNCPWKVRRFNFFDYNERPLDKLYWGPVAPKGMAESLKMVKNPNVTVRMRGVMEKCTFCIQRIEEAKIGRLVEAGPRDKNEVPVGPFQVACQQACPSRSIVFGDQNDPDSAVAKNRALDRGYVMFYYLNTRPRITYLARIKNPNMKMPGAELVGNINTPHENPEPWDQGGEALPSGVMHGAEASET